VKESCEGHLCASRVVPALSEISYEEATRKERTRMARELDALVQTFLSASRQLGVTADSLPSDLPVKLRLDRILQIMDDS
jgi:signal transduction histidine kinase